MKRWALGVVTAFSLSSMTACDEPVYMHRPLSSWLYDLEAVEDYKRRGACEALGEMGPAAHQGIPAAVERLDDRNEGVQEFCRVALGKMGKPAIPHLEPLLVRPEPHLRFSASSALLNIDAKHIRAGEVLAKVATGIGNQQLSKRGQKAIIDLGADGVGLLLPYLDEPYPPLRLQVVKSLGKIGPEGRAALPDLKKVTRDERVDIRVAAMQAMVKVGKKDEVVPVLRGLLDDPYDEVADNAGALLQYIGARKSHSGFAERGDGGGEQEPK